MAPSKLRKAIGAVKDQTSIGLAKVSSSASISDLEVTIVKATRHDEYPADEKHIREILSLTCYSRAYISTCIATLSRRLSKTRSWTVALKTLILIHRLLTEGDPAYEQEIFFSTRRGTRMLNMSDFRDTSRSDAWDFSAFVRTYARYLDERLEYRMHGRRMRRPSRATFEEEEQEAAGVMEKTTSSAPPVQVMPVRDMKTEKIFVRTKHLQQLLERFLACRPTGAAKNNRIVAVALYPVVKESYQLYLDLQELIGIYVDRFMELEVPDCIKVYEIFCRLSKQFDELDLFYSWCKTAGVSRPSEFPEIEKITQQKLDVMDDFIRDKSVLAQTRKVKSLEQLTFEEDQALAAGYEESLDVKALPAPETVDEEFTEHKEEAAAAKGGEEEEKQIVPVQKIEEEVDFLNLRDDTWTSESHADKLTLALFDGHTSTVPNEAPAWEAFTDHTTDWETALVQSASHLSGQKPSLGGGFDMLLLEGMYSQPRPVTGQGGFMDGTGSASSMALPKAAAPMLALPAPTSGVAGDGGFGGDPFAASLAVPAPAYVQMSDMEKKQQLMTEEQMMWQQYAKDRTQGQLGVAKLQQAGNHPVGGGYIQRF